MNVYISISFLVLFVLGISILVLSFSNTKKILKGEETKIKRIIINSASMGLSVSIIFFASVFLITSITDRSYNWSIINLIESFGFFSILGVVIFFGSLWQFFLVGKYRDLLGKVITKKKSDKDR